MKPSDARELLTSAIPELEREGIWADLGAGDGTFTTVLADLLDSTSRIYAVDRDPESLATLRNALPERNIIPVVGDFAYALDLPGLNGAKLSGLLFANSLHYLENPAEVLARNGGLLEPAGRVVVIEYDRRDANQWVPYPIPITQLGDVFARAGFSTPAITAKRPSRYGGDLYVATAAPS